MDSLALLCNLYGDGPATLRRLRVQGVSRIEDLAQRSKDDLAAILALPPATARRFLSEASTLMQRVLEAEVEVAVAPLPQAPSRAGKRVVLRGKDELLDAAARRWHELERSSPQPLPREPLASAPRAAATPLTETDIGRATYAALSAAGIETFEELLECDSEVLAQSSGLGVSQVLFAQGTARRRLREAQERKVVATPAPGPGSAAAVSALGVRQGAEHEALRVRVLEPAPPPKQHFSPSERAPREWLSAPAHADDGPAPQSAGPFA